MKDNIIVNCPAELSAGDKLEVKIVSIHREGVAVRLPQGGCGIVTPKCWGSGVARENALAQLQVGQTLGVVVRSYDRITRHASLALQGRETLQPVHKKGNVGDGEIHKSASKILWCVDLPNIIGCVRPEFVTGLMPAITDAVVQTGDEVRFCVERPCLWWLRGRLSEAQYSELLKQCKLKEVSVVYGEADLVLLQMAKLVPEAVIVTNDALRDYKEVHPEIVGTERVKKYTVVSFPDANGCIMLSIAGIRDGIVVKPQGFSAAA